MKTTALLASIISSAITTSVFGQAVEKKVAFRNTAEDPPRYVTMIPNGGLNVASLEITSRQVFTLVDTNGGELEDGDEVQIKFTGGEKPNVWYETPEGKIHRIARAPDDAAGRFKIKKTGAGISLQAGSGKFVATTGRLDAPSVTDASEKAAVFEVIENPTVKPGKESTKPSGESSPAAE